jgi:hypothetical protein
MVHTISGPSPDQAKPNRLIDRASHVNLTEILNLPGRALLDERQAAAVLHVSVRVLQDWRIQNSGPKYIKINGKTVRYRLCDLEAYQDAQPTGGEGSGPHKARRTPGKS